MSALTNHSMQHIATGKAGNNICCFGEPLLRMSPALDKQWLQKATMPVYLGGAELNVAFALAKWEQATKYCSALPDNYLADEIMELMRERGLDTSGILRSGHRIGTYYLPLDADLKHAGVIYDRANSSFADIKPGDIDWESVLRDVSWFHFSAISPAVSESVALVCEEALSVASKKNIFISVDLNYRAKLWKYGKSPIDIMPGLLNHCNLVMGNIWAAADLLGININDEPGIGASVNDYLGQATASAGQLMKNFPGCKLVANTFRFERGKGIEYFATLNDRTEQYRSPVMTATQIAGKIGSGDCFMAGLIYGLRNNFSLTEVIAFATAAGFGKLQELSDSTDQDIASINKILVQYGSAGQTR